MVCGWFDSNLQKTKKKLFCLTIKFKKIWKTYIPCFLSKKIIVFTTLMYVCLIATNNAKLNGGWCIKNRQNIADNNLENSVLKGYCYQSHTLLSLPKVRTSFSPSYFWFYLTSFSHHVYGMIETIYPFPLSEECDLNKFFYDEQKKNQDLTVHTYSA